MSNKSLQGGLRLRDGYKRTSTCMPIITIVTVVKNDKKNIRRTILSVLNQDYRYIEYIIIDGGSEDGTLDIIKEYDWCIDYWLSEDDAGIYAAMNKACLIASGDGITFLNSGDYYVGQVIPSLPAFPYIIPWAVKYKDKFVEGKVGNYKYGMPVSHQSIFYKNRRLLYDTRYIISSDYDYSIRSKIFDDELNVVNVAGKVVYDGYGLSAKKYVKRDIEIFRILFHNYSVAWIFFIMIAIFKWVIKFLINMAKGVLK